MLDARKYIEKVKSIVNSDLKADEMYSVIFGDSISYDSARRQIKGIKAFLDKLEIEESETKESVGTYQNSIKKDGTQTRSAIVKMSEEESKNPEFLLKIHGYDSNFFELVDAKNSIWGNPEKGNYSSRITVKPISGIDTRKVLDELSSYFHSSKKEKEYSPKQYSVGSEILVPCIFDAHFNKYCFDSVTGKEYSWEDAKESIIKIAESYVDKLQGRKFEKIVFPVGNDFFNAEPNGSTIKGTKQDNCADYTIAFTEGTKAIIGCINLFRQLAPVDVILVQGNHSGYTEFFSACVLDAFYKDDDYVSVDISPSPRKYRRFGNVLLGFSHGDCEKDRIYSLMQYEAPDDWGKSVYREWILGHVHHENSTERYISNEQGGVVIRHIPSITPPDNWHIKSGYTMAKQKSMGLIYDQNCGLSEIHYINV